MLAFREGGKGVPESTGGASNFTARRGADAKPPVQPRRRSRAPRQAGGLLGCTALGVLSASSRKG